MGDLVGDGIHTEKKLSYVRYARAYQYGGLIQCLCNENKRCVKCVFEEQQFVDF